MKLLIEIGNSRLKWATLSVDGDYQYGGALHYEYQMPADMISLCWPSLQPTHVYMASVGDEHFAQSLQTALMQHWSCHLTDYQTLAQAYGLTNGYAMPEQLGVDRWLQMIAGMELFQPPFVVVGMGTAHTIDVVDAHGQHEGGLITPGVGLMQSSLLTQTYDIRHASELAKSTTPSASHSLGSTTDQCLTQGTTLMVQSHIKQTIHDHQQRHGALSVLITGGESHHLKTLWQSDWHLVPDLVLQGLSIVAEDD